MPNAMRNDVPPLNFFGFVVSNPIPINATTRSQKISNLHTMQFEQFIHVSVIVGRIDAAGRKKE
jgi:hypothetical protein